jgi:hypothetical protein
MVVVGLLLTLLVVALAIAGLLAAGSFFLQGYFYEMPNSAIAWQAPTMAVGMTVFYLLWCLLNSGTPGASRTNVPYQTIFAFNSEVDMYTQPVKKLWTIKKGDKTPVEYNLKKEPIREVNRIEYKYRDTSPQQGLWYPDGVEAVLIEYQGEKVRFEPVKKVEEGDSLEFISDGGWSMKVYNRMITGQPRRSDFGYFLGVVLLNLFHWALWFIGLWLVLRFQWPHALLLSMALWVAATLFVLPLLLPAAAELAAPLPAAQALLAERWLLSESHFTFRDDFL